MQLCMAAGGQPPGQALTGPCQTAPLVPHMPHWAVHPSMAALCPLPNLTSLY
ncbi:hypothetical protein BDZ94DRAFT_1316472 [Collybia nuda]|uniref:Uncharacterized protein n=1 Tax=Collybia nuda TaxID=64659 RepID=A0A9P5XQU3_9AGAR|nr:hypothetical protein BDZ94DRAFT_1316472 [Collybia nuda]